MTLSSLLENLDGCVETVELFRVDVAVERHFSFGTWPNRQHVILRLGAGEFCGWGECIGATGDPDFDVHGWGAVLETLKLGAWSEVGDRLQAARGVWPNKQLEMTEMAVLDLAARLKGVSVLELLGLKGRQSVPGLFCILESDPQRAAQRARFALQHGLKTHAKIKVFGDPNLDCALIAAVRRVMGSGAYLSADANGGYTTHGEDLVRDLNALRAAGLDACEDPARLAVDEWVKLQNAVGELALIPDEPLRPAWKARETIVAGMGRIYNIHPGTSGSLVEAVALAQQIEGFGAGLMVGDDSLVGPACTAWQQMAIGLGAQWVEALEKPDECDSFMKCVRAQNTIQQDDGRFGLQALRAGFGLDVDETRLRENSAATHRF